MAPKDLMIGNWIYDEDNTMYTWEQEDFGDFVSVDGNYTSIYPIPLTPEILEKCGFILDKGVGWWFLKGVDYKKQFPVADTINDGVKWVYDTSKNVHCKYLHQLQNLYWCLYGEELNIKL